MTKWEEAALDRVLRVLDFGEICPGSQVGLRGSASDPAALGRSQRVKCVAKADGTAAGDSRALLTRIRSVPGCRSEPALSGTDRSQRVTFICPISKRSEFLKVNGPVRLASSFHAGVRGVETEF